MPGAICDFQSVPEEPCNPEVAWKIAVGYCPNCLNRDVLLRWVPRDENHHLCTHYHCRHCEADYCWPMAWGEPGVPVWVGCRATGFPVGQMKKAPDTASIESLQQYYFWNGRDERGRFSKPPEITWNMVGPLGAEVE